MINSEELYHYSPDESGTTELILSTNCAKDSIEAQVKYMVDKVHNGEVNALQAGVHISAVMKVCEEVKEAIRSEVITEVGKYGKTAEVWGTEVTVKESGTKYDYSHCGDVVLNNLNDEMNALSAQIKQRQSFLKTLSGSTTLVNEDTGEIYTVHPPRKTSTTTYAVTHK